MITSFLFPPSGLPSRMGLVSKVRWCIDSVYRQLKTHCQALFMVVGCFFEDFCKLMIKYMIIICNLTTDNRLSVWLSVRALTDNQI